MRFEDGECEDGGGEEVVLGAAEEVVVAGEALSESPQPGVISKQDNTAKYTTLWRDKDTGITTSIDVGS